MSKVSLIRNGQYLLKDITWHVHQGEHWAVLGLNGSGKTLLLSMISGYLMPSKGSVAVLGKTFGAYNLQTLRTSLGWVSSALREKMYKGDSALSVVVSGRYATIGLHEQPSPADRKEAAELLGRLDCAHVMHRPYQSLSQGEQQKVLIARSLIHSPDLLVLDEPTTGLDLFAREQLLAAIKQLQENDGPTLIYVTHHPEEILPGFTQTLLLKEGSVYRQGATTDLLQQSVLTDFLDYPVDVSRVDGRVWIRLSQ